MKNLCMLALSLLLLAGCGNNEEVLPYEVPLKSCSELGTSDRTNSGSLSNESGIIRKDPSSDEFFTVYYIFVEGGFLSSNKKYVACNLPPNIEKEGQRIRFNAQVKAKNPNECYGDMTLIEITSIKLIK